MLNLLFPRICSGCESPLLKSEDLLCITCRHQLPLICHHRTGSQEMKSLFYGKIPVEQATALLRFEKKGITQRLMHQLKYKGQKKIGPFFGEWLGAEIAELEQFRSIDMVIPVPLHKQRLRERGFNQVEGFGKAIASKLGVPYQDDILLKRSKTSSQVFKQRLTRFISETKTDGIFLLKRPEALFQKHILLVDDIVTTGATLEKCASELLKTKEVKISLATIAIA